MTFAVTVLGSGSAMPARGRNHSAHALNVHEQFYMIDCGEGTQSRMMQAGISPLKIKAVFISHIHGDHIYGFFPLLSSMNMLGRMTPLEVFAPAPFGRILEMHRELYGEEPAFDLLFHEVDTRQHAMVYQNKVMEVWTIPLRHRVPAAGFFFREKEPALNIRHEAIRKYSPGIAQMHRIKSGDDLILGDGTCIPNAQITYRPYSPRSYAYCSDTQYSGKVASIVAGCDLLYHEATFADQDKVVAKQTGHSTAAQAAKCALTAGVGKLLIGHFSGRYKDPTILLEQARDIFPDTEIATEGCTYAIPLVRMDGK